MFVLAFLKWVKSISHQINKIILGNKRSFHVENKSNLNYSWAVCVMVIYTYRNFWRGYVF